MIKISSFGTGLIPIYSGDNYTFDCSSSIKKIIGSGTALAVIPVLSSGNWGYSSYKFIYGYYDHSIYTRSDGAIINCSFTVYVIYK